mgnify:CR=1 FL=1
MGDNFNILKFAGLSEERPWELNEPLPTNLRAVIAAKECPALESVGKAIATFVGESIDAEKITPPESDIVWSMRARIVGLPADVLLWAEPLNAATSDAAEVKDGWVLALQTVLHTKDPLTHFSNLMRILAGSELCVHSVCDLSTNRWFPESTLKSVFMQEGLDAPEEVLWITRLVEAPSNVEPEDRWAWISTNGLSRCGHAEVEMLGVPSVLSTEAICLVDGIAALTFETPLAAAGKNISLGPKLLFSTMECNQAVEILDETMPGRADRNIPSVAIVGQGEAVLCPTEALDSLRSGNTPIPKTLRSTARSAELARIHWDVLLRSAIQINSSEHAACMVQIPWSNTEEEESPREYLWFRIVEVQGQAVVGELAHQPQYVTSLENGHREKITSQEITDWVLMTPIGPMGPNDSSSIEEFLDQFVN